jgi:hypothetical protein
MFTVIVLYANNIDGVYGDIYTELHDLEKDHPEAHVLLGYGVMDTATGFTHIDSSDWYWTRVEAQAFIDEEKAK